ncbi:hypothetical protein Tco_0473550, partial [Tanacetum coccineum]
MIWKSIQNGPTPHPMITDPLPTDSAVLLCPHRGRNLILNSVKRKTNLRWLILKLVNDMKITQLNIPTHQMNTKFVNNLSAYWGKYVTNVKQNMDISTTP